MQYQEFTDARALRLHYQKVRARLTAPRPSLAAASPSEGHRAETREVPIKITTLQECRPVRGVVYPGRVYGPFPIARDLMHVASPERAKPNPREIMARIAAEHRVSIAAMTGERRTRDLTTARFAAICAVRDARPDMSLPQIGKLFCRDHTTILHCLRKHGRT